MTHFRSPQPVFLQVVPCHPTPRCATFSLRKFPAPRCRAISNDWGRVQVPFHSWEIVVDLLQEPCAVDDVMTPVAKHFTRLFIGNLELPNTSTLIPGGPNNPVTKFDMLVQAVVTGSILQIF